MESSIYSYSLCIALPLMLFFGFYFLFAKTPEKAIFKNYLRSRRIMGVALLLLAANYSVHFLFNVRFKSVQAAILLNLSTYFLCYYLFSSAMIMLLDRFYTTRRRILAHLALWLAFSGLSGVVLLLFPGGTAQQAALLTLAVFLMAYGFTLAHRIFAAYRRAVRIFDDTRSDDIGAYIKWLSIFTHWAIIFGVGCALLTFLPDDYVYIWILSSVPFYIYLFYGYMNYLLFYEQVAHALESEMASEEEKACGTGAGQVRDVPLFHTEIAGKIKGWIETGGYVQPGLTLKDLSDLLHTNRTYLSAYIKTTYDMSFRDWITGLRIAYAKGLLTQNPRLTIADISERSGFMSPSHFTRLFKENAGCTPVKWRKTEAGLSCGASQADEIAQTTKSSLDNKTEMS